MRNAMHKIQGQKQGKKGNTNDIQRQEMGRKIQHIRYKIKIRDELRCSI